jgi:hypothetical protein
VIWAPPPPWIIAMMLALAAQIVVMGVVFYARGWKRGALAIPVGLVVFVVSVVTGVAIDIALAPLDPLPLFAVLSAGIYGTYALMMWRRRPVDGEQNHAV